MFKTFAVEHMTRMIRNKRKNSMVPHELPLSQRGSKQHMNTLNVV
jgi:hypothetical protein